MIKLCGDDPLEAVQDPITTTRALPQPTPAMLTTGLKATLFWRVAPNCIAKLSAMKSNQKPDRNPREPPR